MSEGGGKGKGGREGVGCQREEGREGVGCQRE